jgi:hypothetical protein
VKVQYQGGLYQGYSSFKLPMLEVPSIYMNIRVGSLNDDAMHNIMCMYTATWMSIFFIIASFTANPTYTT